MSTSASCSSRDEARAYWAESGAQELWPIQTWVLGVQTYAFKSEVHRQSAAMGRSPHAQEDQAFIDSVSDCGGND
jgi:hypothetical protein